MAERIQHVCFDKDGTLIDVHQSWVPITQRRALKIRQFYGLGEESHQALALAMGVDLNRKKIMPGGPVGYQPRPVIIEKTAAWLNAKNVPATADQLAEIFRGVDRDIQEADDFNAAALPGVVAGIKRLKQAGLKISVYTSDRHKNTERVLALLGLEKDVDAIVGGDDVKKPKPDAEGFIKACAAVGVPLAESIYVGDTVDDMRMAGPAAYGIAQGLSSKEELAAAACHVFDSFTALTEFLLQS